MNTITIKDPNGNIVCSVENMNPVKSEEGGVKRNCKRSRSSYGYNFLYSK